MQGPVHLVGYFAYCQHGHLHHLFAHSMHAVYLGADVQRGQGCLRSGCVYLATSDEVQGLVAQGRTIQETVEIARDVAK